MKKNTWVLTIALLLVSGLTVARDDWNHYSIQEALKLPDARLKLNSDYTFRFGSADNNDVIEHHGKYMANKKTNAVGKSDKFACQWAFLSAMFTFQDRVSKMGGNAVVNIRSYYKKHNFDSQTEFECGNGAVIAGVTLVGDVVTLKD